MRPRRGHARHQPELCARRPAQDALPPSPHYRQVADRAQHRQAEGGARPARLGERLLLLELEAGALLGVRRHRAYVLCEHLLHPWVHTDGCEPSAHCSGGATRGRAACIHLRAPRRPPPAPAPPAAPPCCGASTGPSSWRRRVAWGGLTDPEASCTSARAPPGLERAHSWPGRELVQLAGHLQAVRCICCDCRGVECCHNAGCSSECSLHSSTRVVCCECCVPVCSYCSQDGPAPN